MSLLDELLFGFRKLLFNGAPLQESGEIDFQGDAWNLAYNPTTKRNEVTFAPSTALATAAANGFQAAADKRKQDVVNLDARAHGITPENDGALNSAALETLFAALIAGITLSRVVFFEDGEFSFDEGTLKPTVAIHAENLHDVEFRGVGSGRTVWKLGDAQNSHLFNLQTCSNIRIRGITLNGNRTNQTVSAHCIRTAGISGLTIEDVEIEEASGYGIGLQVGLTERVFIHRAYIHDTGSDGIDLKNPTDGNKHILLSSIVVENHGLNTDLTVQAGIDVRGPVQMQGICIRGLDRDLVGVRFRESGGGSVGDGGHRSSLMGFEIQATAPGTATMGVVSVATDVTIAGGNTYNCYRGVQIQGDRNRLFGVTAELSSNGGFVTTGADTEFTACHAIDGASIGYRVQGPRTKIHGGSITGNAGTAVNITAAGSHTAIEDVYFNANGGTVADAGTNTHARNNVGWVTAAQLESEALDLDSTGSKTAVIPHGLAVTPTLKQIQVTPMMETSVSDYTLGFWRAEAVDATNITVRARVTGATASAGAKFKLAVSVDARP